MRCPLACWATAGPSLPALGSLVLKATIAAATGRVRAW